MRFSIREPRRLAEVEVVTGDARRVHHLGEHGGEVEYEDGGLLRILDQDGRALVRDEDAAVLEEVGHLGLSAQTWRCLRACLRHVWHMHAVWRMPRKLWPGTKVSV